MPWRLYLAQIEWASEIFFNQGCANLLFYGAQITLITFLENILLAEVKKNFVHLCVK